MPCKNGRIKMSKMKYKKDVKGMKQKQSAIRKMMKKRG